jgi:hypothetical protein
MALQTSANSTKTKTLPDLHYIVYVKNSKTIVDTFTCIVKLSIHKTIIFISMSDLLFFRLLFMNKQIEYGVGV